MALVSTNRSEHCGEEIRDVDRSASTKCCGRAFNPHECGERLPPCQFADARVCNPISRLQLGAGRSGCGCAACTAQLSVEKAPTSWMYFNRGLAFKVLGKLDAAQRDYSKAIELDPSFAAAYANRGNVRIIRNDVKGAMADFRKALALDPNDDVTRANVEAIEAALRKVGAGQV